MFGDLSAWCFKYPGGFRFSASHPGYKRLTIQPCIIPEWKSFHAEHRGYATEWKYSSGKTTLNVTVPDGCVADVILPDGKKQVCKTGKYTFSC